MSKLSSEKRVLNQKLTASEKSGHYLGLSPILIQDSYIPLASNSNTSLLGIKSFVKTPSGCPIHPLLSAKNKSSDCYNTFDK